MLVGVLCAMIQGAGWPVWSVWFGEAIGSFNPDDIDAVVDEVADLALLFVFSGLIVATATMTHVFIFATIGSRQANRIRSAYLSSILRQEIGWHDANAAAGLDVQLSTGVPRIEEAISFKVCPVLWLSKNLAFKVAF